MRFLVRAATTALFATGLVACGGRVLVETNGNDTPTPPPEPTSASRDPIAVFTGGGGGACPSRADTTQGRAALAEQFSIEELAIVTVTVEEECTGLGGQYLLADDLYDKGQRYFLGGHGCRDWSGLKLRSTSKFGVLRYSPTSSQQQIPPGICVGSSRNREQGITTSANVRGMALFDSQTAAEAFAETLGWQR